MATGSIGIALALAEVDQHISVGKPNIFQIRFVKDDGSIGEIKRACKGSKNPKAPSSKKTNSNFKYNIKHNAILLLTNLDLYNQGIERCYRSVKIPRIIEFNGQRVVH